MENEDVIAIFNYDFFKVKAEENDLQLPKNFVSLNRDDGVVKKKNGGGKSKYLGVNHLYTCGEYTSKV
jgi:hypothetical protein